jgi:hypothetical protein
MKMLLNKDCYLIKGLGYTNIVFTGTLTMMFCSSVNLESCCKLTD